MIAERADETAGLHPGLWNLAIKYGNAAVRDAALVVLEFPVSLVDTGPEIKKIEAHLKKELSYGR